ncbi:hypothetical protein FG93_05135 [Bosea sp. LC85]|uniref:hypothetical protein n=1 Tax=Bosea sp. LC85 TaxID=1502851 RepID=UPI0004E3829C|nr:hypothetical protein [Bosea sp. LC85]KFC64845.1 hypothetical protein FG93_05135 [Bosea sp. LC85]
MALRTAFAHRDITRDVKVSIMALIPVFVAVGSLVGDMCLMALAMLRMLPGGFVVSFHGLSTSLLLACCALIFDRVVRDAGFEIRYVTAPIRKVRGVCLAGAFALGSLIPIVINLGISS